MADSSPKPDDSPITLQQAADQLGVHYMTVYKYVRTGRLAGFRDGGEWRVDPADLDALRDSTATRRKGRSPKGKSNWPKRFERQLLAGDEAGAWAVAQDALASGVNPDEFHLSVLIPTMRSIGIQWESGNITVAEEHQASAIALRIVGRMGPQFAKRGRKRGHIVIGAPPEDNHSLPTSIFADLLRARHFRVSDLGGNVPTESFVKFVVAQPALTAIGIGVTTKDNEDNVRSLVAALKEACEVPVIIGGSAIPDAALAIALGADAWSGDGPVGLELFDEIARLGHVPQEK